MGGPEATWQAYILMSRSTASSSIRISNTSLLNHTPLGALGAAKEPYYEQKSPTMI